MGKTQFERKISRYELDNKCFLLEDDAGADFATGFKTEHIHVRAGGKTYHGVVRDFYVGSKFKDGIAFLPEHNTNDFFFDQSVSGGKRVRIATDPAEKEGEMQAVEMEVFLVTHVK